MSKFQKYFCFGKNLWKQNVSSLWKFAHEFIFKKKFNVKKYVNSDNQRMKILQIFERVWKACPTQKALDENIGLLERNSDIFSVIQHNIQMDEWQRRFISGKSKTELMNNFFIAVLAREPKPDEIYFLNNMKSIISSDSKKHGLIEKRITAEFKDRFHQQNIVPGCDKAAEVNCTWMRKRNNQQQNSFSQRYEIFHETWKMIKIWLHNASIFLSFTDISLSGYHYAKSLPIVSRMSRSGHLQGTQQTVWNWKWSSNSNDGSSALHAKWKIWENAYDGSNGIRKGNDKYNGFVKPIIYQLW